MPGARCVLLYADDADSELRGGCVFESYLAIWPNIRVDEGGRGELTSLRADFVEMPAYRGLRVVAAFTLSRTTSKLSEA